MPSYEPYFFFFFFFFKDKSPKVQSLEISETSLQCFPHASGQELAEGWRCRDVAPNSYQQTCDGDAIPYPNIMYESLRPFPSHSQNCLDLPWNLKALGKIRTI